MPAATRTSEQDEIDGVGVAHAVSFPKAPAWRLVEAVSSS